MREENIKSPWSSLSSDELQKIIGNKTLEKLIDYLPLLRPKEFDENNIYKSRNLANIFNAFSGADMLEKKNFRFSYFSSLDDDKLKLISKELNLDLNSKRENIINYCSSLKWEKNHQTIRICEICKIDPSLLPEKKEIIPQQVDNFIVTKSFKQLKSYQASVVYEALDQLKKSSVRFIIQMPTGSGKTRVATEIISQFINSSKKDLNILWLAHQKELCAQTFDCFIEVWSHLKNKDLTLRRLWDETDKTIIPHNLENNNFFIGNFQKIHSELKKNLSGYNNLKKKLDLIIIDEAHKTIAKTYKEVINFFAGTTTKIIGLTATPGRSIKNQDSNKQLSEFFHDQKVIIKTNNKKGVISHLRDLRILSKASYEAIHTEQNITLTKKQIEYIQRLDELPSDIIYKLSNCQVRNYEILKRIDNLIKENPTSKIIFFGLNIEHSKFICALLNVMGIIARHVDGSTSLNRRAGILDDFKNKNLQVLCNDRLISTGFDAPKTDTIIIAKPTFSIVLYSQIIGRGLRGPEIGGTEYCKIIDVKDNIQGYSNFDAVYEYFDEYFEDL